MNIVPWDGTAVVAPSAGIEPATPGIRNRCLCPEDMMNMVPWDGTAVVAPSAGIEPAAPGLGNCFSGSAMHGIQPRKPCIARVSTRNVS